MKKNICIYLFLLLAVFADCKANTDSLQKKAIEYYDQGSYDKAVAIFEARLNTALKQKDKPTQAAIYNNLGNCYSQTGNVVLSLKYYQQAVTIAEQLGDKRQMAKCIKNIGSLYSEQKDFKAAISYFDKSEGIAKEINDTSILADIANNKGVAYEQQKKYPEALQEYKTALEIYKQLDKEDGLALGYNNIGIVYKYLGDYNQSISYYKKALALSEKLGNQFFIAANLSNIGNVYQKMHSYPKAIELNKRANEIAKKINAWDIIVEATGSLAEDYAAMGDYNTAYAMYRSSVATHDSIVNIEKSKQLAELQTKYETEKKEKEITDLKNQREISNLLLASKGLSLQKRNYQVAAILGIGLLLAAMGYFTYNKQQLKQKQHEEKAVLNAEHSERMRIAKDMHDDLGSGLSKISLMAGLAQERAIGNVGLGSDISHISHISKELVDNMRDLIWVLNPDNITLDHLVARLREYSSDYLDGMPVKLDIIFPATIPGLYISREAQRNIFLTVKEAINNCVKHADAGLIVFMLAIDNNKLEICISDDGKGFDKECVDGAGNGLRNMKQRIETIGGAFAISSMAGSTEIKITVPFIELSGERHTRIFSNAIP